jgi:hypothetical protein
MVGECHFYCARAKQIRERSDHVGEAANNDIADLAILRTGAVK